MREKHTGFISSNRISYLFIRSCGLSHLSALFEGLYYKEVREQCWWEQLYVGVSEGARAGFTTEIFNLHCEVFHT